jgi:hypothetical protein
MVLEIMARRRKASVQVDGETRGCGERFEVSHADAGVVG